MEAENKTSNWWYLLPIFFGIIGGLIMFIVLKDEDRKKAKNGIKLGVILTVAGIVLYVGIIAAIGSMVASEQTAADFEETNERLTETVELCIRQVSDAVRFNSNSEEIETDIVESCDGLIAALSTNNCGEGSPGYDICKDGDGSIKRYFEIRETYEPDRN